MFMLWKVLMMRFDVLTLFPSMFRSVLGESIIGRAEKAGIIETNFIDIRDSWSVSRKIIELPIKNLKILLTFEQT